MCLSHGLQNSDDLQIETRPIFFYIVKATPWCNVVFF